MSRIYRRKKQQYVFGAVVLIFALVAVLFFLILYLPVRADYLRLAASIEQLRQETTDRTQRLERLQDIEGRLGRSRSERLQFLATETVSRNEGFAAILPDLERLAQIAGIRRSQIQYDLAAVSQFGLYSVRINIPVQGSYSAVTRFIRELERAETLFILDSIGLNRSQAGGPDNLDLALNLTTFFSDGP